MLTPGARSTCPSPGWRSPADVVRRGFTIVELLVVIGVLLVLLSLLLPAVSRVRTAAVQTACMVNIRSAGQAITLYAERHKGYYPYSDRLKVAGWPEIGNFLVGANIQYKWYWPVLFREDWKGLQWSEGMRCPRQPRATELPPFETYSSIRPYPWQWEVMPQYLMSDAMKLPPSMLTYDIIRTNNYPPGVVSAPIKIDDVKFPSKKVLIYEAKEFCMGDPAASAALVLAPGEISDYSSRLAIALVDGSAQRIAPLDTYNYLTPPEYASRPPRIGISMYRTIDGVRGRDIP
jgi:prepilin-type N-terminal cleavage/methylation domain-containing protein